MKLSRWDQRELLVRQVRKALRGRKAYKVRRATSAQLVQKDRKVFQGLREQLVLTVLLVPLVCRVHKEFPE